MPNSKNSKLKKIGIFILKHWYFFPVIKYSIILTLFITFTEDGIINPFVGEYVCEQSRRPFCYVELPDGHWVLKSRIALDRMAQDSDTEPKLLHGWLLSRKNLQAAQASYNPKVTS